MKKNIVKSVLSLLLVISVFAIGEIKNSNNLQADITNNIEESKKNERPIEIMNSLINSTKTQEIEGNLSCQKYSSFYICQINYLPNEKGNFELYARTGNKSILVTELESNKDNIYSIEKKIELNKIESFVIKNGKENVAVAEFLSL